MAVKEQAVLEVSVTGVDNAASQFTSFQQTTTKTMSASEAAVTRSLNNMVSQFIGLAAVARSVQNVVSSGVGFDQFVENTTMSFTVMMKSADKAKQQMKDLYDFAVASPLTFKETAASSKQLMAYGFTAEELIPTMKTLGSVAIATGHSLDDISYVYGTLKSQGRAYSRDLMQFGMRGIPIYEELAKVMGVNVTQIQKLASEGKIGFAEVETAFQNMTTGSGRFSGILEGYMATLTGKLSMLSDIGQQSMGTLMQSVTDQLKLFVDEMTKAISGKGFQSFIEDAGSALGVLAGVLAKVLEAVVALLPVLSTMIKVLALPAIVLARIAIMSSLPGILMGIGDAASTLAAGFVALNSQLIATTAAESAMAMGAATASTGIAALSSSLVALAAANPWLLALIIIAAAGGAVITIINSTAKSARNSTNENVRAQQLSEDYAVAPYSLKNISVAPYSLKNNSVKAEDVAKIAEQYKLTEGLTANILKNTGALSGDAWQQYLNTKSANVALTEQEKIATGLKHVSTTIEQDQMAFLSNLTGKDASVYEDLSNVDLNALGNKGAKDYIAGFAEARAKEKDIFGFAYSSDQLKQSLEAEAKGLTSALESGSKVDGLFDTNYDETLRSRLAVVNKELDGMGKKAKKVQQELIPVLSTWWTPMLQSAKNTLDPIDDMQIAQLQSLESVDKEYANQVAILDKQATLLASEGGNETELNNIAAQRVELFMTLLGLHKDINAESEKQQNLKKYELATEGNSAVMDQWKASAGAAYTQGGVSGTATGAAIQGTSQTLSGTQMGTMATGGNPVAVAVTALVDFAKSIKNVNAVLNPFTTIFEAMRSILEPIINNVLQPLVDILQMVGEAIAPIIGVLVAALKPALVILYLAISPVIAALQILAAGFTWFYNYIIVPVANGIINIANAIIKVLNRIPGVHIRYIDQLQKMGTAVADLTATINNQKSALDKTITYLTNKINNAIDDQLSSLKDLYEVGAVSATSYDAQVTALNAQKISTDSVAVSSADMALTGKDIYERLYALYDLKDTIENGNLSSEKITELLQEYGISAQTEESLIKNAVLAALQAYNASTGGTSTTTSNASDTVLATLASSLQTITALAPTIASLQSAINTTQQQAAQSKTSGSYESPSAQMATDGQLNQYRNALNSQSAQYQAALAAYNAALIAATNMGLDVSGYKTFAVGTANVPSDMTAQIHKGEGIIPSTFMDSIRSGELTLSSGKNGGSGQNVVVSVTVQGSVQTENDLATSIAQAIYVQRSRGALTV